MSHLPPINHGHLMAAFVALRLDKKTTFDEAMLDDLRRQLIVTKAHHIRTQEWAATQTTERKLVRRFNPRTGNWITEVTTGQLIDKTQEQLPCI